MKIYKKLTIIGILTAIIGGSYYYTHTLNYITNNYNLIMAKECGENPLCTIGIVVVRKDIVTCLKNTIFPTWQKNIDFCIKIAADKFNESN